MGVRPTPVATASSLFRTSGPWASRRAVTPISAVAGGNRTPDPIVSDADRAQVKPEVNSYTPGSIGRLWPWHLGGSLRRGGPREYGDASGHEKQSDGGSSRQQTSAATRRSSVSMALWLNRHETWKKKVWTADRRSLHMTESRSKQYATPRLTS